MAAQCPFCNVPMEIVQTKSKLGKAQFAQACRTHGRRTVQCLTAAGANTATILLTKPKKYVEPV